MIRKRKIGPGAPPFKTDRGQTGYVPNVVFTCGAVLEEDGPVKIYWGERIQSCAWVRQRSATLFHCVFYRVAHTCSSDLNLRKYTHAAETQSKT
ncbi:hypothetical protein [uncultured Desulfobacter sp.]|uniref:hypothetical protein n=1 Tax=uncultured Desulfobacter sp. TaxID=240139 RepID=UPI0029F59532|nr:hypothetical protein [uncultured Desulfobacter sp.]